MNTTGNAEKVSYSSELMENLQDKIYRLRDLKVRLNRITVSVSGIEVLNKTLSEDKPEKPSAFTEVLLNKIGEFARVEDEINDLLLKLEEIF